MTIKINVPNIGEEILEITEIMVKVGDNIHTNQCIAIIEGDKSSMEIPSMHSGIVKKIYVNIGDHVHTGSLILTLFPKENHCDNPKYNPIQDHDIQSTSSNIEDNYKLQQYNNNHCTDQKNFYKSKFIHASPLIRHMARAFQIDLSQIIGSGRKGRILREDIQNYINTQNCNTNYISEKKPKLLLTSSPKEINFKKFEDVTIIKLNKIKKISGKNLKKSWTTIPHVTQFHEADITDLENFRNKQNLIIAKQQKNFKITSLVFVIKSTAKALERFPQFNSSLSQDEEQLIIKNYINIGIAVNTNQGLLVPVIHDANKKNIITLAQELSEISKKANTGNQLKPSDIQGSSFTISNLGSIGGNFFTPIINAPEVAILGISKAIIKPIWTEKEFVPRLILPLSLSYDHRVIDGADGVKFILLISEIISDIRLLSM